MSQKISINHGISTSYKIYELFRTNCRIIKPGQRFYPMGVQILKLDIHPKFSAIHGSDSLGLNYMADCLDCDGSSHSVLLAEEFAAELNQILHALPQDSPTDIYSDLRNEYLGLFPIVANERGLYNVSVDLVPGGLDEYGYPTIKNKFFITCRLLNESCLPAKVFSCVWEFKP